MSIHLRCLRCGKEYAFRQKTMKELGCTGYSYCESCLHEAMKLLKRQDETGVKPDHENVNHPEHYQGKHECIDEMVALFGVEAVKAFCRCNVYKYRFRSNRKGGQEDLDKADWYMEKLMELEE